MAILGHGVDLVEVARIAEMIERHGEHFLNRCFTATEQEYCASYKDSAPHYAGRFAAKEAIAKALGTGFRGQINWTDMEILPDTEGRPVLALKGPIREAAGEMGISHWHVSISHTMEHAMASAIAEG
ncbi:MAG TPA: holo-ACP synthase [Phycisphaerae bacterium]|nr:holo-ACP synthase [Phycisphaerae bacterium]